MGFPPWVSLTPGPWPAESFDPLELTPALLLDDRSPMWSDDGITPAVADGAVYRRDDRSGNARHSVQTTEGFRPLLKTMNGRAVLRYDGTDDYMQVAVPIASDTMTIFAVLDANDTGAAKTIIECCDGTNDGWRMQVGSNEAIAYQNNAVLSVTAATGLVSPTIVTGYRNATDQVLRVNGVQADTDAVTGLSVTTALRLGARSHTSPANYFSGDIAAIIIYLATLTSDQIDAVELYLSDRYGISI